MTYAQSVPALLSKNVGNTLTNYKTWGSLIFNANDYGAKGDGLTDDTAALQSALNAASDAGGGSVYIGKLRTYIAGNLTIPLGCGLVGFHESFTGQFPNGGSTDLLNTTIGSTIIIDSAATINFSSSSFVVGVIIIRKGCQIGDTNSLSFAGTALTSINTPSAGGDGGTIRNCMILGFNRAIDVQYHHRLNIQNVAGDNINGIRVNTSWDVMRIRDVHFYPYVTSWSGNPVTNHHRAGVAIELVNQNDICQVTNVFTYGYLTGLKLNTSIGTGNFINCHFDGTGQYAGSRGMDFIGSTNLCSFLGCTSYSNTYGAVLGNSMTDNIEFTNCRFIANTTQAIEQASGISHFVNCHFDNSPNLVVIHEIGTQAFIDHCTFTNATTAFISAFNSAVVYENDNDYIGSGNIGGWLPVSVASADPLTLPKTGDFFNITGTTGFGNLAGGWTGRRVTMKFSGALTVFNGSSVNLTGSVNLTTTANTTLELIHDGTQWLEVSRSVK